MSHNQCMTQQYVMKWYILKRYMSHNSTVWIENMSPNVFVSEKSVSKHIVFKTIQQKITLTSSIHCQFVGQSIHPSICLSIYLSVRLVCLSVCLSCLSVRPSIRPSVLSIHPSVYPSVCPSVHPSIRLSVLSVHPLSVCQWVSATVYYSICQSIR